MQMQLATIRYKLIGIYFLQGLTWTERDVFYSRTEGYSCLETAKLLNIKVSTLKKHRENICNKIRDILDGECTCKKTSRVGLSWFRFALKTGIMDGQRWLERAKNAPLCRG
jgi:hypothetical protein